MTGVRGPIGPIPPRSLSPGHRVRRPSGVERHGRLEDEKYIRVMSPALVVLGEGRGELPVLEDLKRQTAHDQGPSPRRRGGSSLDLMRRLGAVELHERLPCPTVLNMAPTSAAARCRDGPVPLHIRRGPRGIFALRRAGVPTMRDGASSTTGPRDFIPDIRLAEHHRRGRPAGRRSGPRRVLHLVVMECSIPELPDEPPERR
jgi:hypothetical protein